MTLNVTEIKETEYRVVINTDSMSEEESDELYNEISCLSCCDEIEDIKYFLEDKGLDYDCYEDGSFSRIEM